MSTAPKSARPREWSPISVTIGIVLVAVMLAGIVQLAWNALAQLFEALVPMEYWLAYIIVFISLTIIGVIWATFGKGASYT